MLLAGVSRQPVSVWCAPILSRVGASHFLTLCPGRHDLNFGQGITAHVHRLPGHPLSPGVIQDRD